MFRGFVMYADAPSFSASTALSRDAYPVTISMPISGCISRSGASSAIPSISGSFTSTSVTLKKLRRATSRPSRPVPAVSVSYPCRSKMRRNVRHVLSSSSTIRTRMRSLVPSRVSDTVILSSFSLSEYR